MTLPDVNSLSLETPGDGTWCSSRTPDMSSHIKSNLSPDAAPVRIDKAFSPEFQEGCPYEGRNTADVLSALESLNFEQLFRISLPSFLKDLGDLIAIESVKDEETAAPGSPFGLNISKALEKFLEFGKRDSFLTSNCDGYAGTIILNEEGREHGTVGILGHIDVVPVDNNWSKDPFSLTLADGYLFGRGVRDDKGAVMAVYYAMKMIRDLKIPLKRRVMLIAGTDEESGMECMDYYREHGEIPDFGFCPDALFPVVYAEKGRMVLHLHFPVETCIHSFHSGDRPNAVPGTAEASLLLVPPVASIDSLNQLLHFFELAEQVQTSVQIHDCQDCNKSGESKERAECIESKESTESTENRIELSFTGTAGHAASPWFANHAGVRLLQFIGASWQDPAAQNLARLLGNWQGWAMKIYKNGADMGFLTVNPGVIRIENNEADIVLDIRYPNEADPEYIQSAIRKAFLPVTENLSLDITLHKKPLLIPRESPLIGSLMDSYRQYAGKDGHSPLSMGGGTYAKKLPNMAAFGPIFPGEAKTTSQFVGGAHQKDEGIRLDSLIRAVAVYADAIIRLANMPEDPFQKENE